MTTLHLCTTCPNLVPVEGFDSSDGVGRCLQCVAEGKTVSWPGVWVGSEEFQSRPLQERLVELARGYLKSAMTLCEELGEHPDRLDWPRASVVYFLIHHAAELFLKGCILLRAPSGEKLHHDVSKLQDRYCELFPELKDAFHIETPMQRLRGQLGHCEVVCGLPYGGKLHEYAYDLFAQQASSIALLDVQAIGLRKFTAACRAGLPVRI